MRLVLEPRPTHSWPAAVAAPIVAIALTLLAGGVLFALIGRDPVEALATYFFEPLTDAWALQEIVVKATPLALIALGLSLCFLSNNWNIGAEGQFVVGAICGGGIAVAVQGTEAGGWVLPAMILAGMIGGAAYALLPAVLKVRFGASEILTSLMLVYIAELLLDYLVRGPWRDPQGFNFPTTAPFEDAAIMPLLIEGSRVHWGAAVALVGALVMTAMLGRTLSGFKIILVGQAPRAGRFAGFSDKRLVLTTFAVSGALAGLAGVMEVAGPIGQLQPDISPGYGFTAIIVALLGRLHPIGIVAAALFLALTFIGGESAQITLKVPLDLTLVFQGILLFFVLACDTLVVYRLRIVKRSTTS